MNSTYCEEVVEEDSAGQDILKNSSENNSKFSSKGFLE